MWLEGRFCAVALSNLSLFEWGQPAKKVLCVTYEKLENDLGKDKPTGQGFFMDNAQVLLSSNGECIAAPSPSPKGHVIK